MTNQENTYNGTPDDKNRSVRVLPIVTISLVYQKPEGMRKLCPRGATLTYATYCGT